MVKYIFPATMIVLNVGQCIVMLWRKDIISAVYWLAAAALNFTVAAKS